MAIEQSADWRPAAPLSMLQARAVLLKQVRSFMEAEGVLEVETPLLVHAPVTEVNIDSFSTEFDHPGRTRPESLYLHSSPEYAMKRLLAAGTGAIYQICKVFRNGEAGAVHNPEFTMLEWYRPGLDHHALMDALNRLLQALNLRPADRQPYAGVFHRETTLDPHAASLEELQDCAAGLGLAGTTGDRARLLDFIFSHSVIPGLGREKPVLIYDLSLIHI